MIFDLTLDFEVNSIGGSNYPQLIYCNRKYLKFELTIFDCDGVLVHSEIISNKIAHEAIINLGLNMNLEESEKKL